MNISTTKNVRLELVFSNDLEHTCMVQQAPLLRVGNPNTDPTVNLCWKLKIKP